MTGHILATALAELGTAIDFPPAPDLDVVFARLEMRPQRRLAVRVRWAVAAVAVAVVALMALVTPVREAVADWLGIGAIRIVEVDEIPTGIDEAIEGLGLEVPLDEASVLLGTADPWPATLGPPDRIFIRIREEQLSEMSMVWLPRPDLPEVGSTGVGALLTRFDGILDLPVIEKSVAEGTSVLLVTVGDVPGYWIDGDAHTFGYLGPDGEIVVESVRLAGSTLLWEDAGVSYRLESTLDLEAAIRVAETVETADPSSNPTGGQREEGSASLSVETLSGAPLEQPSGLILVVGDMLFDVDSDTQHRIGGLPEPA